MSNSPGTRFEKLLYLVKSLRSPDGCPWDRAQKKEDVGRYLRDETYEVIDAIENRSSTNIREELGDVLFQVLFLAGIAEEEGAFTIEDVIEGIREKMIRRHPHVFGKTTAGSVEEVKENWETIKKREKNGRTSSFLEDIPRSLPPFPRACKITTHASRMGFDWEEIGGVMEKIEEELAELKKALNDNCRDSVVGEIGDLLFSMVNLCRFADVDPERALTLTIGKFERRLSFIEEALTRKGKGLAGSSMEEMDRLWELSKQKEPEAQ